MNIKNLITEIEQFDTAELTAVEVYDASSKLKADLSAYYDCGLLTVSQYNDTFNLLNGIVKNKLSKIEKNANKRAFVAEISLQEIFAEKVANACINTWESTPVYNMGVTAGATVGEILSDEYEMPRSLDNYHLIHTANGVMPVLKCANVENSLTGLDWVTFSFDQITLGDQYTDLNEDELDHGIRVFLDAWLHEIFGFGLGQRREKGMHFYKYAFELQDNLGLVLFGHNSKRISVQINGTGCALARKGWNVQLYDFLKICKSPKLNRVDVAFDDLEGDYISVDLADQWDDAELFWCGGRNPIINKLGDWKRINGSGRTFTVGDRTSGKFARIYERGKKEGDALSLWTRAEVEFKATDRYIPLDILLYPTSYFVGAYPAFECLTHLLSDFTAPSKTEIVKKQSNINWDKAISITKHQFGKYIRQFRKVYDDSALLDLICSEKDDTPKRLIFSHTAVIQSIRNKDDEIILNGVIDELPLFVNSVKGVKPYAI